MRKLLITGGTGSFGKTMLRDVLARGVDEVRVISRDEEKQDALRNELRDPRVRFYVGDIRDRDSVDRAMAGVDCAFHAAALKQVPSCEFFPIEAVRTNILGSENVTRSAVAHNVASLGSGLIDHNQKMTVAAIAMADMKVWAQRSYRV